MVAIGLSFLSISAYYTYIVIPSKTATIVYLSKIKDTLKKKYLDEKKVNEDIALHLSENNTTLNGVSKHISRSFLSMEKQLETVLFNLNVKSTHLAVVIEAIEQETKAANSIDYKSFDENSALLKEWDTRIGKITWYIHQVVDSTLELESYMRNVNQLELDRLSAFGFIRNEQVLEENNLTLEALEVWEKSSLPEIFERGDVILEKILSYDINPLEEEVNNLGLFVKKFESELQNYTVEEEVETLVEDRVQGIFMH